MLVQEVHLSMPCHRQQTQALCCRILGVRARNIQVVEGIDRWTSCTNIAPNRQRNSLKQQVRKTKFRSKLSYVY